MLVSMTSVPNLSAGFSPVLARPGLYASNISGSKLPRSEVGFRSVDLHPIHVGLDDQRAELVRRLQPGLGPSRIICQQHLRIETAAFGGWIQICRPPPHPCWSR